MQVLAQPVALALAQLAELVVIGRAKRGLPVANEVNVSHAQILSKKRLWRLSLQRLAL